MENNNIGQNPQPSGDTFTIKKFLTACALKWKWFLISVICFTALGVLYVMVKQPVYERTMAVLIKDQNEGGGVGSIANSFSSLGLVSTSTSVYNEMISLTSPAVMSEVVKDLKLDVNYLLKGIPHGTTLYGSNLPFEVEFVDVPDSKVVTMTVDVYPDGSMVLRKFRKYVENSVEKYNTEVKVPQRFTTVSTPLGKITFKPNPKFSGIVYDKKETIEISKAAFLPTVEIYSALLKGELADRDAEVINLSIDDVSKERGDDILTSVLNVYTQKWVNDKNRISEATSEFISERLARIKDELGNVDNDMMQYRKEHLMPDLGEAGRLNLASTQENEQQILTLKSRLMMAQYVVDYVKNPANARKVIPMNGSTGVQSQISSYNSLLMARDNLAASTSDSNPLVKDYDSQLTGMRETITRSLDNEVVSITTQLRNLQGEKGKLEGQLAQGPEMQKYLVSVGREQKVKEQLYLFLLQKREENELTQKFTADNTRIITPPMGPVKPVSPKKKLTVMIAFLFGLALPGIAIYVKESSNTKVRSRKDLEHMTTPFLGEIPFIGKRKNKVLQKIFKKKGKSELEKMEHVVRAGSRDLINESFRIVRGNLDFMSRSIVDNGKVIMVTSFNPGSGKSFVTFNLCASYAIKGKRVLLIDCDLRHGSSSQYVGMPSKGLTAYLNGNTVDWNRLVIHVPEHPDFDVLPIGHRPPNPAELLESDKMKQLISEARKEYDIIFLDCPPVDIVVDTQVLSPLADKTVFIVRAGLLEKTAISDIDALYSDDRFEDMSILLNGTDQQFSRYGSSVHGYYGSEYAVKD